MECSNRESAPLSAQQIVVHFCYSSAIIFTGELIVTSASSILQNILKKPSLTTQVFLGLILGVAVGHFLPEFAIQTKPLATIFLHMIKMLIAPLIFATLVIGIAGHSDHSGLGRMGLRTIIYFEIATTVALVIGLGVANLFQPGAGMDISLGSGAGAELAAIAQNAQTAAHHNFWDTIVHMFPTSVVKSMANGDILQIVVFSVFFALALGASGEKGKPIYNALESLAEVMFKFVGYVMAFAPMGVFGAIAATIGQNGLEILALYAKLVGSLYFALVLFVVVVFFLL